MRSGRTLEYSFQTEKKTSLMIKWRKSRISIRVRITIIYKIGNIEETPSFRPVVNEKSKKIFRRMLNEGEQNESMNNPLILDIST